MWNSGNCSFRLKENKSFKYYRENLSRSFMIFLLNAPCLKSLRSALIVVSFVHMFISTYSVRCSSGANVIGDLSSQCNSNSVVLYNPKTIEIYHSKQNPWMIARLATYSSQKPFYIFAHQMDTSADSSSSVKWLAVESMWQLCRRVISTWAHLFLVYPKQMKHVHWPRRCAVSKVNHAKHFGPLSVPYGLVPLSGTPNEDQPNVIGAENEL